MPPLEIYSAESRELMISPEKLGGIVERVSGDLDAAYDWAIRPFLEDDIAELQSREFLHLRRVNGKIEKGAPESKVKKVSFADLDASAHKWDEYFATIREYEEYCVQDLKEELEGVGERDELLVRTLYGVGALVENGCRAEGAEKGASWHGSLAHLLYRMGRSERAAEFSEAVEKYWQSVGKVVLGRFGKVETFKEISQNGVLAATCAMHILGDEEVMVALGRKFNLPTEWGWEVLPASVEEDLRGVDFWLVSRRDGKKIVDVQVKSRFVPDLAGVNVGFAMRGPVIGKTVGTLRIDVAHDKFSETGDYIDSNLGKPRDKLVLNVLKSLG